MTEAQNVKGPLVRSLRARGVDVSVIENAAGSGQPDLNMCFQGQEIWVECKLYRGNQFQSPLRPSQKAWIINRLRHGGRVWVVARKGNEFLLFDGRGIMALIVSDSYSPQRQYSVPVSWDDMISELFFGLYGHGEDMFSELRKCPASL